MRREIAGTDLNVPVVAHLNREVRSARCALVLADLENALLAVEVTTEVVSDLIAATCHARAVSSAMSVDERAIGAKRTEHHQRIRIRRTQPARLTVERADDASPVGVPLIRHLRVIRRIVRYVPDRAAFGECGPPGSPRVAMLGRYLNDAVRRCRSILRGGGRTLEDFVGFYVFGVDVIEARRHLSADAYRSRSSSSAVSDVVVEANSIDDDERLVGERDRGSAANSDSRCGSHRTARLLDIDTWNLSTQ